jgi:DNA-binding NarL/FixJ family response regulator
MAQTLERRASPAQREHRPKLFLVGAPGRVDPTAPDDVRVLIADGDNLARAGLRALLEAQPDIVVAGCAADGAEAILLAREIRPDVLVVDLALPGIDGVEVTRQIVTDADTAGVRVVIVSASEHDDQVVSALRAGASGFLLRDTEPAEFAQRVRAVAAGEGALSPKVVHWVIAELASQPRHRRAPAPTPLRAVARTPRSTWGS